MTKVRVRVAGGGEVEKIEEDKAVNTDVLRREGVGF